MAKSIPKGTQRGADKMAASIKKRQEKEKTMLLKALEESPNLGQALARIDKDRSTYYRWRQDDEVFAMAADSAMFIGREKIADLTEVSLISLAREGNVQAIKFYLEHNHLRYKKYGWLEALTNDGKLSLERQRQIAKAMKNWFHKPSDDTNHFIKS